MRISDWSSDVCSSDLMLARRLSGRLRLRPLDMRAYAADIRILTDIFNDAWHENWGLVPFTESEVDAMDRDWRLLIAPCLGGFVEWVGEPVAVGVCLNNVTGEVSNTGGMRPRVG